MTKKQVAAVRAQIAREMPFYSCDMCSDGWVPKDSNGYLSVRHVSRCVCWFAHQAKVDAALTARTQQQEQEKDLSRAGETA